MLHTTPRFPRFKQIDELDFQFKMPYRPLIKCPYCDYTYLLRFDYMIHIYSCHKEDLLSCSKCKITYQIFKDTAKNISTQIFRKTDIKSSHNICESCLEKFNKVFSAKNKRIFSIQHHYPQLYKCPGCKLVCAGPHDFYSHRKRCRIT